MLLPTQATGGCLAALGTQLLGLKEQIVEFDRLIMAWYRSNETRRGSERPRTLQWKLLAFLQRPRDIADAVDEGLHHRSDSPILQRDYRDWPGKTEKIDRQYAEREVLGWGKTQHGARQQSNKTIGGEQ